MGAPSGFVAINSSGPDLALFSAFPSLGQRAGRARHDSRRAASRLTGDVNTAGTDAANPSAGPVDIAATGGALSLRGNVNANGRDNPAGNGANAALSGTDVRVGRIDASAGASSTAGPGLAGSVTVAGSSSVTINDIIDTRGASGATGFNCLGRRERLDLERRSRARRHHLRIGCERELGGSVRRRSDYRHGRRRRHGPALGRRRLTHRRGRRPRGWWQPRIRSPRRDRSRSMRSRRTAETASATTIPVGAAARST